jgi:hypothetical protein
MNANLGIFVGAVLVVVGFFLGWVGVDFGPATLSISGWQVARLASARGAHYYLIYAFPVGAVIAGLVALADRRAAAKLGIAVGGLFVTWASIEILRLLWRTTFLGLWLSVCGAFVLLLVGIATRKATSWS